MNANAQQVWPVLADAVAPANEGFRSLVRDAALVVGACLFTALLAQVKIPLGFTPVPITGQTFAVLLVGGSVRADPEVPETRAGQRVVRGREGRR